MMSSFGLTDKGRYRAENQDAFAIADTEGGLVAVVCDGMGGAAAGRLASDMAVKRFISFAKKGFAVSGSGQEEDVLRQAADSANRQIYHFAATAEEYNGMGTTLVGAVFGEAQATFVNVGDSRAYLVRDKVMRQLTEDHTLVQDMLRSGLLTKEEAMMHPDRNMITRAIGGEETIEPDFYRFETCPGDVILLCTDGLYGEVSANRILQLSTEYSSMHELAKKLVDEANEAGGKDNISVVCIRIGG